jgi:hypothetical protein
MFCAGAAFIREHGVDLLLADQSHPHVPRDNPTPDVRRPPQATCISGRE